MASRALIDAQFDRAVEIVQSLPRNGPIQTDYEEKLQMYSLYKQATVGNVKSPRPGIWDMLGRAKWDAWAKHKDLVSHRAKRFYVEALLKVLRRYSDKTMAETFVQELESYGDDPSNLVLSRASMQSPTTDSSRSTASRDAPFPASEIIPPIRYTRDASASSEGDSTEEETEGEETGELRTAHSHIPPRRPHSSHSTNRYQTPIAGSLLSQTPAGSSIHHGVPETQPLPTFKTPSAFPAPPSTSTPNSTYNAPTGPGLCAPNYPPARMEGHGYRAHSQSVPPPIQADYHVGPVRAASRLTLERALEGVQAHLAALTERLEVLESRSPHSSSSSSRGSPKRSSYLYEGSPSGSGRLPGRGSPRPTWDLSDLGMWSYVLNPISRIISILHKLALFFARDESRSPAKVIVRRLCLDISFLVCVVAVIGSIWRKSGVRRREVKAALVVLWRAVVGNRPPRSLHDRRV